MRVRRLLRQQQSRALRRRPGRLPPVRLRRPQKQPTHRRHARQRLLLQPVRQPHPPPGLQQQQRRQLRPAAHLHGPQLQPPQPQAQPFQIRRSVEQACAPQIPLRRQKRPHPRPHPARRETVLEAAQRHQKPPPPQPAHPARLRPLHPAHLTPHPARGPRPARIPRAARQTRRPPPQAARPRPEVVAAIRQRRLVRAQVALLALAAVQARARQVQARKQARPVPATVQERAQPRRAQARQTAARKWPVQAAGQARREARKPGPSTARWCWTFAPSPNSSAT